MQCRRTSVGLSVPVRARALENHNEGAKIWDRGHGVSKIKASTHKHHQRTLQHVALSSKFSRSQVTKSSWCGGERRSRKTQVVKIVKRLCVHDGLQVTATWREGRLITKFCDQKSGTVSMGGVTHKHHSVASKVAQEVGTGQWVNVAIKSWRSPFRQKIALLIAEFIFFVELHLTLRTCIRQYRLLQYPKN